MKLPRKEHAKAVNTNKTFELTHSQTLMPPHSIIPKFRRSRLSARIGISKIEHPISNTQFPISIGIEFIKS